MSDLRLTPSNTMAQEISPLSPKGNLKRYLQEVHSIALLKEDEEYALAKSWLENRDMKAAHKLVTAHLRLVAKIAAGYRGYGLPYEELISEGTIGMMHAVKRFDPDKGARLSTYASWWIRASIQEYVLRNWSLVKIGTTTAQKKLFFNLRAAKERIGIFEKGDLNPEQLKQIASDLNVSQTEVQSMNRRMHGNGDLSLNAPTKRDDEGEGHQWQDWIESEIPSPEAEVSKSEEIYVRRKMLKDALTNLNSREAEILSARRLHDTPATLENLSQKYNISRERVRQIESRAFEKVQISMQKLAQLPAPKIPFRRKSL